MVESGRTGMPCSRGVRAAGGAALVALLALGPSACGADGVVLPTVSRSGGTVVLPSASVTLPEVTRSPGDVATPTRAPGATATPPTGGPGPTTEAPSATSEAPVPTPTGRPSTATVTATPSPAPTQTVTETSTAAPVETVTEMPTPTTTPTPTPAPSSAPSPSPASTGLAADDTGAADEDVAPWVWLLLLGGLVVAGLTVFLVPRARRRREWAADLAADEAEVAWFAGELLPRLQLAATADALEGGWDVAAARVTAVEDRLTGLESTASDDSGRVRARSLRDAVRTARLGVEELVFAGRPGPHATELSLLASRLDAALAGAETVGPPASGTG